MAGDDGQDNSLSGSRALTVNKSASSKQSSNNTRSHSRSSSNNTNRRGMIPSEAQQRVMSNSLGGGIIRIALSPSSTPRESPFASPKPSRTNTTNSTTPDPGPSVAARDASNSQKKNTNDKGDVSNTLPKTAYTISTKKKTPTPSQYSPSIYNGGDDWTKAPSPPLPVPAMPSLPLPTLAATTYTPRSARNNPTKLNDTSKSKSKGATRNPPKKLTIKSLDYDPELEPKPLSTPRINRQKMKIDPRDEKDRIVGIMKEKPLPARPDPSKAARKKTIKDISVPLSPAATTQPTGSLGTAVVARTQPIQATKMVKIRTKQVARRQPQVVQVQEPSSSTATSNTGTSKVAALARTKSRITRIMSFGGTPAAAPTSPTSNPPAAAGVNNSPDEGAGGGWWDMLDNVLRGPLKPPPRPTAITQPSSAKKGPEMRAVPGGGLRGSTMSIKQGVFDPKNLI